MAIPTRFVKGNTIEEKLAAVETTLRHFSRRLQKTGTVIIPPIPIFARSFDSGMVFRGLIPYKGRVIAAAIAIGKFLQRPASATFTVANTHGDISITVVCEQRYTTKELALELSGPSVLEITVEGAEDILVSVMTQAELSRAYREMMLLEAVLGSYEASEDLEEISE